jgi:tripartite-type tricarboxylate transporter receptor subunit TctC
VAAGKPNVDSGKLRLLAVGAEERSTLFPDVPTVMEAGVPGYAPTFWYAVYAPAGMDKAIVARISEIVRSRLASAEIIKKYGEQGYRTIWTDPEKLRAKIRAEVDDWRRVAAATGIKLQ